MKVGRKVKSVQLLFAGFALGVVAQRASLIFNPLEEKYTVRNVKYHAGEKCGSSGVCISDVSITDSDTKEELTIEQIVDKLKDMNKSRSSGGEYVTIYRYGRD